MGAKPNLLRVCGILGITFLTYGCANMAARQDVTSGAIGAPPSEIEISNDSGAWSASGVETWTAKYKGKTYYCSRASNSDAKCTEAQETRK